uniref:Uncharacterized protein n=1 Tax=Anopheles farauti TaxID=69004 RepID=A0A182QSF2_9DIPT
MLCASKAHPNEKVHLREALRRYVSSHSSILVCGGPLPKRTRYARELLLSRCCLFVLMIFCWQQTTAQPGSWADTAKAYESEESYDDADGDYDENEEGVQQHHITEALKHGVFHPHAGDESEEFEYEEQHRHIPNAVPDSDESSEDHSDSFGHSDLFAQIAAAQLAHGKKQKKGKQANVPPVTITVPYPVHVERKVPVFIEKKVPVYIEKKVEVPVDRPYEVPVPVKVPVIEKEVIHVPKPIVFNVDRPYPVYVQRTVFVDKYRPFKVLIKSRTRY